MIFLGDTHCLVDTKKLIETNFDLIHPIRRKDVVTNIISVGDIGLLPFNTTRIALKDLDNSLKERALMLFIIRGNHDSINFFQDNMYEGYLDNIVFVRDYIPLNIEGKKILPIGGAVSIDRVDRIARNLFWEKEEVIDRKSIKFLETLETVIRDVDIIVSHTAPKEFFPYTLNNIVKRYIEKEKKMGLDLLYHLEVERNYLSKVYEIFKPTEYYYGHFHSSNIDITNNGTKIKCLGINELFERRD